MASLSDAILKKPKKLATNRGIFETADDAASSVGRVAPAVTPLGQAQTGVNPDVAKMAGTPAAKTNALRASTEGSSLQEAIRNQGAETGLSKKDEQTTARIRQVGNLGGLEDRVQKIVTDKLNTAAATPVVATAELDSAKLSEKFPGINAESANGLWKTFSDPNASTDAKRSAAIALASQLKIAPPEPDQDLAVWQQGIQNQMSGLLKDQTQDVANAAAQRTADNITMDEVFQAAEFRDQGNDVGVLAGALGIPTENLKTMTVQEFQSALEKFGMENASDAAELTRRANDPYTSDAERQQILGELRRLGATGVRASEQDFARTVKSVDDAQQVEVGGRSLSVGDALSDERISKEAVGYLTASPAARQEFQAKNPQWAAWLDANSAVLLTAAKNAGTDFAKMGQEVRDTNLAAGKVGGHTMSNATLQKLIPNYGQFGYSVPAEVTATFSKLAEQSPEIVKLADGALETGALSLDQLNRLLDVPGLNLTPFLNDPKSVDGWYNSYTAIEKQLAEDPEGWMQGLYQGAGANNPQARQALANTDDPDLDLIFDGPENDGVPQDPKDAAAAYRKYLLDNPAAGVTLADKIKSRGKEELGKGIDGIPTHFYDDNKFDDNEIAEMIYGETGKKNPQLLQQLFANKELLARTPGLASLKDLPPSWLSDGKLDDAELNELYSGSLSRSNPDLLEAVLNGPLGAKVQNADYWKSKRFNSASTRGAENTLATGSIALDPEAINMSPAQVAASLEEQEKKTLSSIPSHFLKEGKLDDSAMNEILNGETGRKNPNLFNQILAYPGLSKMVTNLKYWKEQQKQRQDSAASVNMGQIYV